MAIPNTIRLCVQVRRRLAIARVLWFAPFIFAGWGLLLAILFVLFRRQGLTPDFLPFNSLPPWGQWSQWGGWGGWATLATITLVAPCLLIAGLAILHAWFFPGRLTAAALRADTSLNSKDLLRSSLELSGGTGRGPYQVSRPFTAVLLEQSERLASGADPRAITRIVPAQLPARMGWSVGALLLLVATGLWMPLPTPRGLADTDFTQSQQLVSAEVGELSSLLRQTQPANESNVAHSSLTDVQREIEELEAELRGKPDSQTLAGARTRAADAALRAAERLDENATRSIERDDALREAVARTMQRSQPRSDLARALAEGDFQRAAQLASDISNESGAHSENAVETAEELRRLSDAFKQAAAELARPEQSAQAPETSTQTATDTSTQTLDGQPTDPASGDTTRDLQPPIQPGETKPREPSSPQVPGSDPPTTPQDPLRPQPPSLQKPEEPRSAQEELARKLDELAESLSSAADELQPPPQTPQSPQQPDSLDPQQPNQPQLPEGSGSAAPDAQPPNDQPPPEQPAQPSEGQGTQPRQAQQQPAGQDQPSPSRNAQPASGSPDSQQKPAQSAPGENPPSAQPGNQPQQGTDKPQAQPGTEQKQGSQGTPTPGKTPQESPQPDPSNQAPAGTELKPGTDAPTQIAPEGSPSPQPSPQDAPKQDGTQPATDTNSGPQQQQGVPQSQGQPAPESQSGQESAPSPQDQDQQQQPQGSQGIERLVRTLQDAARQSSEAQRSADDAQRLRQQAEKIIEGMSPEARRETARELERIAQSMNQDGRGQAMPQGQGTGGPGKLGPIAAPRRQGQPATKGQFNTETLDIRRPTDPSESGSRVIAEWDAPPREGEAAPDGSRLSDGLRTAARSAERAIEQQAVPPQYSDLVRRVFQRYIDRERPQPPPR